MEGNEAAIQAIRNKALKDIINVVRNLSGYCWQEETPEQAKINKIDEILTKLEIDIKKVKDKYQSKISPEKDDNMNSKLH